METMSKKHFEQMKKQVEEIIGQKAEGIPTRDILAQIYVNGLENKSMEQGWMMADEALLAISDFHQTYAEAVEDKNGTLEQLISQMLDGKNIVERCNILAELYAAVSATTAKTLGEDSEECDKVIKFADENKITEDQATSKLEGELKENVIEAMNESAILTRGLIRQADEIDEMISANGVTQMILQIGEDETEYEGILTMLGYVESKTGKTEELPPDLTIQEVAYIVAATMEEEQIVKRYVSGEIAMGVAVALLDILGVVLIGKLAIHMIIFGASLALGLGGLIIAVPAMAVLSVGLTGVIGETMKVWNDVAVAVVKVGAKVISKGLRKIGEFIQNTAMPAALNVIKKVEKFFGDILGQTRESSVKNSENVMVSAKV